jgi:hypothetical protein
MLRDMDSFDDEKKGYYEVAQTCGERVLFRHQIAGFCETAASRESMTQLRCKRILHVG